MDLSSPYISRDAQPTYTLRYAPVMQWPTSPTSPRSSSHTADTRGGDAFESIELSSMLRVSAEMPLLPPRAASQDSAARAEGPLRFAAPPHSYDNNPYVLREEDVYGAREIYRDVFLGAVCGTVTGIFWGSMLGSFWGAQSDAESLQVAAPAALGLGTLIGGTVAFVRWRKAQRAAFWAA